MKGHLNLDPEDESELARREGSRWSIGSMRSERAMHAVDAHRLCSESQLPAIGRGSWGGAGFPGSSRKRR